MAEQQPKPELNCISVCVLGEESTRLKTKDKAAWCHPTADIMLTIFLDALPPTAAHVSTSPEACQAHVHT